jgi:hypothetical protein
VEPARLQTLSGVPTWQDLPPPDAPPLPLPSLNEAVHNIIDTARQRNGCFMRLRVVTRGRPEEALFNAQLFEDKIGGVMSYSGSVGLSGSPATTAPCTPETNTSQRVKLADFKICNKCVQAYLYIGPDVESAVLQDVLGLPSWQDFPPPDAPPLLLPRLNTRLNEAVHNIIDTARQRNGRFMRLRVVTRGRPEEALFNAQLFEDKIGGVMSYIEFLCHVHKCICDNLRKG